MSTPVASPPSILEIYIVWHPDDTTGATVFQRLVDHYHSSSYSGFVGGAIEVYGRSKGWEHENKCPRGIPLKADQTHYTVIIPIIDVNLDRAAIEDETRWGDYLDDLSDKAEIPKDPGDLDTDTSPKGRKVSFCPIVVDGYEPSSKPLSRINSRQCVKINSNEPSKLSAIEQGTRSLERDVSQAITQHLIAGNNTNGAETNKRLNIFISHTKRNSEAEDELGRFAVGTRITQLILDRLQLTRLGQFYDARSIQVEDAWRKVILKSASTDPLLIVRTDMYSSRLWPMEEVLAAKHGNNPIVTLSALTSTDERGSFILENVPTVAFHRRISKTEIEDSASNSDAAIKSVDRAISRLVDEALKCELWKLAVTNNIYGKKTYDWITPHTPEPVTLIHWLKKSAPRKKNITILHPDPPMTSTEIKQLQDLCEHRSTPKISFATPRDRALTRIAGGGKKGDNNRKLLEGKKVGLSVSPTRSSMRMGLSSSHLDFAISEISRSVFLQSGTLVYGGGTLRNDRRHDFNYLLLDEAAVYGMSRFYDNGNQDAIFHDHIAWKVFMQTDERLLREADRKLGAFGTIEVLPPSCKRDECSSSETVCSHIRNKYGIDKLSSCGLLALSDALNLKQSKPDLIELPMSESLASMRRNIASTTDARILIGGRLGNKTSKSGEENLQVDTARGTLHEVRHTIVEEGKPVYISAAYGGVGAVLAYRLGILNDNDLPSSITSFELDSSGKDSEFLEEIVTNQTIGEYCRLTGLTRYELKRLALSPHPSEIAAYAIKGIIRRDNP